MAGILDLVGIVNNLDYRPKYERAKCIRSISSKASCNICEKVCSKEAVTLGKKKIYINESCNYCNECVSHCPTNALVDSGRKFVGTDKKIYLLCQEHEQDEDINNNSHNAHIECLNFLSRKILLNIYNNGFTEIYTNIDKCGDCKKSHKLQNELDRTNKILSILNLPIMSGYNMEVENLVKDIKEASEIKKETVVNRRDFFKHLAKDIFGKTYEIAPPAMRVQYWRSTGQIIGKWQQNKENKVSIYKIEINIDRCIQCKACMKMCPKDVWEESDDSIIYRQYLCTGCNLCKDICPTKAIEIEEDIKLINDRSYSITKKECSSCSKEFIDSITEAEECPSCIWKKIKK